MAKSSKSSETTLESQQYSPSFISAELSASHWALKLTSVLKNENVDVHSFICFLSLASPIPVSRQGKTACSDKGFRFHVSFCSDYASHSFLNYRIRMAWVGKIIQFQRPATGRDTFH